MDDLLIRTTLHSDIDELLKLQERVYPAIDPWQRDHLVEQLTMFPEGQLMAEINGRVVGCASSLVILWNEWSDEHTWQEITAKGTFSTHNPQGLTLYGAEVFVDPEMRGLQIGHYLYEGRRQLCKTLNLRRIIACGRLPGYQSYSKDLTAEQYAKKVIWGDLTDPVLSFQLREDFRYCGIMKDYLPQDQESCGQAALIVWINPDYDLSRPTALQSAIPSSN